MGTPYTQCGRPDVIDISKFANYSSGNATQITGDINYGIIIEHTSDAPSNYTLGPAMYSIPEGWVSPLDAKCSDPSGDLTCPVIGDTSGCAYYGVPSGCISNYKSTWPTIYPSEWPSLSSNPANAIQCCTNFASDSGTCNPNVCAESPAYCQAFMKSQCIGNFNNTWQAPQGLAGMCDQYASATASVVDNNNCPAGATCGADFIFSAVQSYFQDNGTPFDSTYFASKIPGMCAQYPGLCDPLLKAACTSTQPLGRVPTMADLNPALYAGLPGRQYDPEGVVPMQLCGCFLQPNQYVSAIPTECQSTCSFPGAVPIGSGNASQPAKQCSATQCVIDNVTANYINTIGGNISIKQVCGQCSASQPCACYFADITTGINAPDISTNCQTCFTYDSTSALATPVACPGAGSSGKLSSTIFWIAMGLLGVGLMMFFVWKMSARAGK